MAWHSASRCESAVQMMREVLKAMFYSKVKVIAAGAFGLGLIVLTAAATVSLVPGQDVALPNTSGSGASGSALALYQPHMPQENVRKPSTSRSGDAQGRAGDLQKPQAAADAKSDAVRALLLEMRDKLRKIVDAKREQYKFGNIGDPATITESILELLEVELKISRTHQERIAILERMIREAKNAEEVARARRDAARAPGYTVLEAEVLRLKVQVRLEEEKRRGE
jgi:hypothetical protein